MHKLQTNTFIVAVIGLTFSWVFFPPVMMAGFFPEARAYSHGNETILGFTLALFVVAVIARVPVARFFAEHRAGALACVLAGLAGYATLLAALATDYYSLPLALAATFILSFSYVALMLCWMTLLARIDARQTTLLLFGSALGYAALTMGNFLPEEGRMALCGLSAALSGLCWFFVKVPSGAAPTYSHDFAVLRHAPFIMLTLLAVLLIGGRIVTGLYFNLGRDVPFLELLVRCASIACVMGYCIFSARRGASLEQGYRNTWVPAAGLFLLGAMILIGMRGQAFYAGLGMTHGALNCFEVLAYLIMFQFVKNDRVSPIMVVSIGMIVFKVLPIALQRLVFPQVIVTQGLTEVDIVPVVILMSMVVLVSVLAFANHRLTAAELHALSQIEDSDADDAAPEKASQSSFEEACALVSNESELSEREAEIMALIARGNSQKHISETLYLALGTVQWYAKSIYRKLGVHSKQELINLVNERMAAIS
ncbi:helix-turn-helix transcriptional regulator [Adlercreutzia sp. R25]|uniref:helix-turn-helix transcriptional regulator n=1 Tax=Adlercreutzia shanghongiae TaxID=3111773 RepID=UPI002DB7B4E8|nr:helix-turn-helix transcriptional regulator [Adlercreutzia sp. R25]MEC4272796.1 helix-turn-helix transcriptional regulator [Adlercreutzia sp. R25]